jgi:hypothetical protein
VPFGASATHSLSGKATFPMFFRSRFLAFALATLATLALVGEADAGWVTIKNDTNKTVVVQEFITVNGKKVSGKPYKLQPGESFREFQNNPGPKSYDVFDGNGTPLATGKLACNNDSQSFSVTTAGNRVTIVQVPEPKKP